MIGTRNHKAKLTDEQVLAIRREYIPFSQTASLPKLAKKYGVTTHLVHLIVRRQIWTHLGEKA